MHLDTHVVVWLYEDKVASLPTSVRRLLDSEPLVVSPMVGFELDLLHEIGRTAGPSAEVLTGLGRSVGLTVSPAPFPAVVTTAAGLRWTRDPFDRLICAQAIVDATTLLTRDRRIHAHLDRARWD
ncbi:MAG TPA: PIN domain-containing protein [Pseudonocardia sp.]|jgi:PIN domain nuclease of toxin-antitoxin system|nr:PIN domain-containing protein [Pseudonocardia sp.]